MFSAGNWSTVLTGFAFNASDGLECRIEGGLTYTCGQSLASGLFANPPTIDNPLILHGCDNSGARLVPSHPDWVSAQPVDWDTPLPIIATTTNIATINLATALMRLVKFTASGRNGFVVTAAIRLGWVCVENSTANTSAGAASSVTMQNVSLLCSGASYSSVASVGNNLDGDNIRAVGNSGSSGNRDGFVFSGTNGLQNFSRLTVALNGGRGVAYTGTNAAVNVTLSQSVMVGNVGDHVQFPNTASQTLTQQISNCMITGGGAYGLNPSGTNTKLLVTGCRLRDNTSGNFGTFGNYPTDLDNYTTDSDDATEYVDAGAGDYRIKYGSAIWGMGYGVADEPAPSGGGGGRIFGGSVIR